MASVKYMYESLSIDPVEKDGKKVWFISTSILIFGYFRELYDDAGIYLMYCSRLTTNCRTGAIVNREEISFPRETEMDIYRALGKEKKRIKSNVIIAFTTIVSFSFSLIVHCKTKYGHSVEDYPPYSLFCHIKDIISRGSFFSNYRLHHDKVVAELLESLASHNLQNWMDMDKLELVIAERTFVSYNFVRSNCWNELQSSRDRYVA